MRKKYLFLLILVCTLSKRELFSQKTYNTWFFGYHSGLDFNTNPPTPLENDLIEGESPPYYTSSICDTSGKLLFFTNGHNVWNSANQELPQYPGKWPWFPLDNVIPLICPYPGNDSLYYLFGVATCFDDGSYMNCGFNVGKLVSVTINMAANSNKGAIVYPDPVTATNYYTVHANNTSCLLAGTAHCNQKDTWIVTVANGAMNSYLLSASGVSTIPVITPLPIPQALLPTLSSRTKGYSNMKFSANGEKLVIPIISENKMLVYDFNNQTGAFSNPQLIGLPPDEFLMDMELSAGGTKLYYGSFINQMDGPEYTGVELHNIYQLNLEAGTPANIETNRYSMNSFPERGGCPRRCYIINRTLNMGPDGKIYISQRDVGGLPLDTKVHVIEFPDKLRENAYYRRNYLDLKRVYKFINFNYIRSGSFSLKENGIQVRKKICLGLPTEFSLLFTKIDSVKWDFGDPASGSDNYSTLVSPIHNYAAVGSYTIKAIIYKNCWTDTASTQISIDPDPIVRLPEFIEDTIVCIGTTLKIDAVVPSATTYQWSDGLIYSYREIKESGQFMVKAYNACSNDQKSFTVSFEECPCDVFAPSAFTPNNDGLNDDFKPLTECFAKDYQFKIYNRYGNIVFSTSELNKGWDGDFKNMPSPTAVYVWTLQYRNPNNNKLFMKQGTVTLIR